MVIDQFFKDRKMIDIFFRRPSNNKFLLIKFIFFLNMKLKCNIKFKLPKIEKLDDFYMKTVSYFGM